MIFIEDVLRIHEILIERFGGVPGVRDMALLESAIGRPYNTFDSEDLYPGIIDKASALIESIVKNHPFIDGNKRTGYTLMRLFLLNEQKDIDASEDDKYDFVIMIAEGNLSFDEIRNWIGSRIKKLNN